MKRFSFPLQRVLDYRRQLEDLAIGRLQLLVAERRRLIEEAGRLGERARQASAEPALRLIVPAVELRRSYEYAEALRRARESALSRADAAEQKRHTQLQIVIAARRDTRLLELLRSKQSRRHSRFADREQENLASELYLAALLRCKP